MPGRCSPRRRRRRWSCRTGGKSGPEAVAPTTSTTMTLALGDALAMTVMRAEGLYPHRFRPAASGRVARRAAEAGQAADAWRQGVAADRARTASMHDAIVEMSEKRLGVIGVTDDAGLPPWRHHGRRPPPQYRARPRSYRRRVHDARSQNDRPGCAGRRGADPVRGTSDHRPVRRRRRRAGRRRSACFISTTARRAR